MECLVAMEPLVAANCCAAMLEGEQPNGAEALRLCIVVWFGAQPALEGRFNSVLSTVSHQGKDMLSVDNKTQSRAEKDP